MFWFCLAPLAAACSQGAAPSGTVATVNGQPISLRQLNAAQALTHFQRAWDSSEFSVDALRKQYGIALASLIVRTLVMQELRKNGLDVPPERIRTEEARIRADYPGGEFEQALLEVQMDIQTWREFLYHQFALELFSEKVLSRDIEPSLQEIQAYYAQHEKEFYYPASLYLRIISGMEKDQVEVARAALLDASGPPLPPEILEQKTVMSKASVPEEWVKDVEALKVGEVSPVRKMRFQHQAVQVLEELPANSMSIVDAYPLIERALIEEKADEKYALWIEQAVRNADIRVSVYLQDHPVSAGLGDQ
jgi:hypothetical protein